MTTKFNGCNTNGTEKGKWNKIIYDRNGIVRLAALGEACAKRIQL